MSAVPQLPSTRVRRRRRRHVGALLAALAYVLAGFALYQLVAPAFDHKAGSGSRPEPTVATAPAAQGDLGIGPRELLALRAVASRVQQSVYSARAKGAAGGSAFVAWTQQGKVSFVLTARSAVSGASGEVVLKHGRRSWPARVVRSDPVTGLAVLRVNSIVDRPLWQRADNRAPLRRGAAAMVVPAGTTGAFGLGELAKAERAFSLPRVGGPKYVGAPVLNEDGRLAGIVVDVSARGSRLVSLADACRRVRACG